MGFLDNATNNIIIDAVLTDRGRQFLAQNNGSFTITKFALGDDEVDYSIIKKFGRTVGREKISKNTPVLEAQTRGNLALKHKLLSLSNPVLIRMPSLTYTLQGGSTVLTLTSQSGTTSKSKQVIVEQTVANQVAVDSELVDNLFIVKMDNRFLTIPGATPSVNSDNIATYELNSDSTSTSQGGGKLTFSIVARTVTDLQYSVNGTPSNKNVIRSYINVFGFYTGAQLIVEAQISKT